MFMLDLCSGLGGASQPMKDRGWDVIRVDNDKRFNPEFFADVRSFTWEGNTPDFIWASPPCTEFSRESMPWCRTGNPPDMSIVMACKKLIDEIKPRYWVIENVRGAVKWFEPILGKPTYVCNPYYLWGNFPDISHVRVKSKKERLSSTRSAERGLIPYEIGSALECAIRAAYTAWQEGVKDG